jgi:ubiquinone/menaquinone biosynthesis C-methylase UbiE
MIQNRWADKEYLKNVQYRDPENLNARGKLHDLFNVTSMPWFSWVYTEMALKEGFRVLEIGCGPGNLWKNNLEHLPQNTTLILTDLSIGMLKTSQNLLDDSRFQFVCTDADSISFPDATFDLVLANHMLYHVADLSGTLQGIRRILKPGGRLLAATNGFRHMAEVFDLIHKFEPRFEKITYFLGFNLQNGKEILAQHFSTIQQKKHQCHLKITESEPLVDYIFSMQRLDEIRHGIDPLALTQFLDNEIAKTGSLKIQKEQGLFIAS